MGLTLSDIIWPSPLFFYHFLFNFHKVNVLRYILKCPPFFWFFCLDFKIKFSPTNFGAFPYFLQFFFCLDVVDDLWHNLTTSLLFYHSLSNYHKVNVLRHILTLPPHFFVWSSKLNFLRHILGPSLTFYVWWFEIFLLSYHFFSNYHKVSLLWHILTLPLIFFNFYCLITKLVFNNFCQNIEHEFETCYQQQWLKWLGRHCFNAMIEWIVESLPRKWILLEYKLIWFMFH